MGCSPQHGSPWLAYGLPLGPSLSGTGPTGSFSAMEESEGEWESLVAEGDLQARGVADSRGRGGVAEPRALTQPPGHSSGAPAAANPDEKTIRGVSNELTVIADTAQRHRFPRAEDNSCGHEMEPRQQTTGPVSLESDFFVSMKLAAVLAFIFVAVTILLVCSKQNEPLPIHPASPKFIQQHALNQKLHKLRLFFPRQSDSFWAALEKIFNQLPADPGQRLQARLVGVGYGDSWNTMLCLCKTITSLLLVGAGDLGPDGVSKMWDDSQVLWSQGGSSPRPGTTNVIIAEIVKNHTCTVTLSLHPVTEPTDAPTTLISVGSIQAQPKQEIFPSNFTLRILAKVLRHLNQTVPINADIPNTIVVVVNPEDHLERGFLC
ncbi:uncharacterized protein LOC116990747 [Amblyraja radiata]|uniref:uncharacterized protein LOC116990747 n=1 Tax=Amblyraja radiata TaxID=386614 RepID=UPI0014041BAF|nr:uncharacterized protein LOC116990747 [Amblyraja radiata]